MRLHRGGAIGAILLAATTFGAACSSGGGSTSSTTTVSGSTAGNSSTTKAAGGVAGQLVLGGPPECATRITCLLGLQQIYGLHFKSFKALDIGTITATALANNEIQVARLDSSDPSILQNHWVTLKDDKSFQQAGNIVPVIRTAKATDEVKSLLNKVSSTLTQNDLLMLDTDVLINHQDPTDVATKYVQQKLAGSSTPGTKGSITVGSAAFSENVTLAYVYADALKGAGYSVSVKPSLGNREIYEPALESGQIDLLPEYAGNYLSFLNKNAGVLTLDQTMTQLQALLTPKNLTVLQPSDATDADAIVVTKATADKYHLTKISDLGN